MHHCPPSDSTTHSAASTCFLQHNHVLLNVSEYRDRPLRMLALHPEGWGRKEMRFLGSFQASLWRWFEVNMERGKRPWLVFDTLHPSIPPLLGRESGTYSIPVVSPAFPRPSSRTWDAVHKWTTKRVEAVEFAKMLIRSWQTNDIIYSQCCVSALNHFGKYKMWSISHHWILKWLLMNLCLDPWCYYHFHFYFYSHNLNCVTR